MPPRDLWSCARCGADNLPRTGRCRRCGAARPLDLRAGRPPDSPALAALLSGLLPGLGQLYQDRWVRGVLMILIPAFGLALLGAFVFSADPLTALAVRHATLLTLLVVGALFVYHAVVVADAFAGRLGAAGGLRGRHAIDYAALALVTLVLVGVYGTVYRESTAWASLVAKVFQPIARAVGAATTDAAAPPQAQWTGRDRLNVLLLGLDARDGGLAAANTDTLIVLTFDPLDRTAAMLSIPRDTLVAIPGRGQDKINAAYSYGGPDLSRRTVEQLLGIPIHSYALIDFDAFTRIVDAVGGVFVDVKRPLRDEAYPTVDYGIERLVVLAGPQAMDGQAALRYARSRHDSNDFSRARRQQDVLAALRRRLAEGGLARLPGVVDRVGTAVETNFDPANILPLARTGTTVDPSAIRSEVLLPCAAGEPRCQLREETSELGYYLIPDRAKVLDLVAEVFYDVRVRQEGARVEVRGSGARPGRATEVADRLALRAFGIASVTDGPLARSAVLLRNAAKRYTAEALAKQLGGLPIETAPPGETAAVDIVVRVGSDFRGFATDLAR